MVKCFACFDGDFFYSGEITFKLHEKWDENLLNENSATYKILEGNVKKAVSACCSVSNLFML